MIVTLGMLSFYGLPGIVAIAISALDLNLLQARRRAYSIEGWSDRILVIANSAFFKQKIIELVLRVVFKNFLSPKMKLSPTKIESCDSRWPSKIGKARKSKNSKIHEVKVDYLQ